MRAVCLAIALLVAACASRDSRKVEPSPPTFEDLPAVPHAAGSKAAIRFQRGTASWNFRTVIREGYQKTPINFAAHYVAISWGCGSGCQRWAVVDSATGSVHLVPFSTASGAHYQTESRLFIANPASCAGPQCDRGSALYPLARGDFAAYYRWDGEGLVQIYTDRSSLDGVLHAGQR